MPQPTFTRGHGYLENFLAKKRAKMANKLIPAEERQGRILDIGCGSHPFFILNTKFIEKYGLDKTVTTKNIKFFTGKEISLVNFDADQGKKLPFSDNYFNIVTMLAVFEHIEPQNLTILLKEIHRVLKPGGSYIMTTPAPYTKGILKLMNMTGLVSHIEIEDHKNLYNHKKIAQYFQNTDFDQKNIKLGFFELGLNIWAKAKK